MIYRSKTAVTCLFAFLLGILSVRLIAGPKEKEE
jgi:hypothetical protein